MKFNDLQTSTVDAVEAARSTFVAAQLMQAAAMDRRETPAAYRAKSQVMAVNPDVP
jgi:hypothetical protein